MPFYYVSIEVIAEPDQVLSNTENDSKPAGGFTARFVRSHTRETAIGVGLERTNAELEKSGIWNRWRHRIDDVQQISWWRYVRFAPGGGFTFYREN